MFSKSQKPETILSQSVEKTPTKAKVPSIISADLHIVGNLKADSDIQIDGIVDGDVESKLLTVGETATVNGCIEGEVIRVAGTVSGEITGRIVELTKSARITGDINHHSLAIEAGAFVQGFCRRINPKRNDAHTVLEGAKPNLMVAETHSEEHAKDNSDGKGVKAKSAAS
ncbi:MAG: cell shape determination protein CcmA [Rickettsiales bacterium]|nr:cell shape determination protein CcmA [Rickettsiales bacterium]